MANTKLPARLLDTSAVPALNVTGDFTVDTITLKVDSTNNRVGVGVASPGKTLDVEGAIRANNAGGSAAAELDLTSGATWRFRSNPTTGTNSYGLDIIKGGAGSDVKMSIDSSGNVGIGYTTPSSMNASGNNLVIGSGASSDNTGLTIFSNSNASGSIHFADGTTGADAYRGIITYSQADNYMRFYTDATERIRIGPTGNVSIGTTALANALTVSDATNISMSAGAAGQLRIEGNGYSGAIALDGDAMHIYQNSTARNIVMGNNETEQFRITAAGDISTNALSAVTTAGGGIWYDAVNKYLSISHWASTSRPTPAAMLHLSDNSNDIDVPQIRIEGRENPGDTRLDIAVKDAEVRLNAVEGSGDASVGFGLFTLKTNAAANTTYPRRGGFKFDVNTTTPVEILNTGTLQLHGNSANWSETTPGHTKGSIHLDPDSNTNDFGNAITFGASDHNNGESTTAGIYLRTDGAYGSIMYLATSDSYATGPKMAMRINHSGHIHAIRGYITSQVPAFNAYYNGNSFAPGGNYIFAANATRFNNGGNYNASNYRFTAPVDGLYRFYFRTITNGSASNQHVVFRLNGSDYSGTNTHFSPTAGSAWDKLEMETLLDLSDGDWVDVRFVTLSISIHGNAWNEFSGHLVG